jgi:N-acyl-L-homoserine lactone synthetase
MARDGGVLVRAGHTEATVDVARLAGLIPAGVICEIMNDDGTMARLPDLITFAQRHNLKVGTIADLIAYRRKHDSLVECVSETSINSVYGGEWQMKVYANTAEYAEHVVLIKGDIPGTDHQRCREIDQFDQPDTVYLLVMQDGAVLGASRMLPTIGPNMMRDVFPALCKDGPPQSPHVWEWSRGHVKPDEHHHVRSRVLDHIFVSGYEFALTSGIGSLTAQINASEFPRWLKRGLVVDVLGPPVPFQCGNELVALKHMVTATTLERVRCETGIHHPVLRYPDEPAHTLRQAHQRHAGTQR